MAWVAGEEEVLVVCHQVVEAARQQGGMVEPT